jgi:hypothetical protein
MSPVQKIIAEIKRIGDAALYFALWFDVMMLCKRLILAEYAIEFRGVTLALVGALVVVLLEKLPVGQWVCNQPAAIGVILRTVLYTIGVWIALLLENPSNHGMNIAASVLRSSPSFSTATSTTSGRTRSVSASRSWVSSSFPS